jgi:hypothetical protein
MNNTKIPNLILNGFSIDINFNHKLTNEYNDEQITTIMCEINIIKDTISKLLIDIQSENKSDDNKYRLRSRNILGSVVENLKSNVINNYIRYQSKMLDYHTRLDCIKSNCIRNDEYLIDCYTQTKNELNLLNKEHHTLKVDYAKSNTHHILNENKLNSHSIEQSIKVAVLTEELADVKIQRDFLKGVVNKNKEIINELEIKNLDNINNKHKMDNYEYEIQKVLDKHRYNIANNVLLQGEFNELENKWKETVKLFEFQKSKTANLHTEIDKLQKYIYKQNQDNILEMNDIIKKMENDKNKVITQAIELLPEHNWDNNYGFISKEYEVINDINH